MKMEIKDQILNIDAQIAKLKHELSDQTPDPKIQSQIRALEETRGKILQEAENALIERLRSHSF